MINVEIDWSDYTDYKIDVYKCNYRDDYHWSEARIEEERQKSQPPTCSVTYSINPDYVVSYRVQKETEVYYWQEKCDAGVASGTCYITIALTNGCRMKFYCYDDAANKIIKKLQGDKRYMVIKVNGVKEYDIRTETKVTSMPDSN